MPNQASGIKLLTKKGRLLQQKIQSYDKESKIIKKEIAMKNIRIDMSLEIIISKKWANNWMIKSKLYMRNMRKKDKN